MSIIIALTVHKKSFYYLYFSHNNTDPDVIRLGFGSLHSVGAGIVIVALPHGKHVAVHLHHVDSTTERAQGCHLTAPLVCQQVIPRMFQDRLSCISSH